ncbi:hypothetical protein P3X46_009559 [Hevea brasiliensis]|uniref:DUF4378 domain-containing protein n=1 Tax=Hevea brasiliensis TaxID=3981 RepID=A0ABQ9MM78_HEVBR|nr:uncharacterized protein LOC110646103 [Hevea brasiliensis]KAJ9181427.1 hypothetical protein P3X46_009559 [Hevea brasiliensis]
MMSQKPLHQLLQEDQEPFLLKNYIADKRCQLKKPSPKTHLQIKKRKPISDTAYFPHNFCKNACFLSVNNSPDLRKSPLFEFQSPSKSPCKSPNAIFLHIPTKTAALLLEAALRIQKQSLSPLSPKAKNNNGFGLFGSLIKRITHRNKTRTREITSDGVKASVKDIRRWGSSLSRRKLSNERESKREQEIMVNIHKKSDCEMGFSCSCNGRPSSAVWSETNEEKSWDLDLETSSSSQSEEEEDCVGNFEFVNKLIDVEGIDTDFASYDNHTCENLFHFVLRGSPSTGHGTPDFPSPATSPSHHKTEDKENNDVESLMNFQVKQETKEEEDKEQCSPVSVLDPPFEDDDDGHDDQSEDNGFDIECSYEIVRRAKQQLLQKLSRFEKLAELDPVELEKRMLEQEEEIDDQEEEVEGEDDELDLSDGEQNIDRFIIEELRKTSFCRLRKIPRDMKRLVSDLSNEEEQEQEYFADREAVVKRVCKRFESWKEVESNTIDMMVEQDFKREEVNGWKRYQEQVGETALKIELGIFGLLVEELSEELVG